MIIYFAKSPFTCFAYKKDFAASPKVNQFIFLLWDTMMSLSIENRELVLKVDLSQGFHMNKQKLDGEILP